MVAVLVTNPCKLMEILDQTYLFYVNFQEIPPPPPPGISMEEANELRENIERLEGELVELKAEIAAKEDANNQLSK